MRTQVFEIGLDQVGTTNGATANSSNEGGSGSSSQLQAKAVQGKQFYTQITVQTTVVGGTGPSQSIRLTEAGTTSTEQANINSRNSGMSAATLLAASIALPLPTELAQSFQQDWSAEEVGALQSMIGRPKLTGESGNPIDFNAPGLKDLQGMLGNKLTKWGSETVFKSALRNHGLAYNPYKEKFYNGVSFRSFQWSWDFAPINEAQYKQIEELIFNLQVHSHPDFLSGPQSPFIIPDSFQVEFVNTKLPKMRTLVLTDMQVNYSNGGEGPRWLVNGEPAYISLSLTFLEADLLTKQRIRELRNQ